MFPPQINVTSILVDFVKSLQVQTIVFIWQLILIDFFWQLHRELDSMNQIVAILFMIRILLE